MSSTSSRSFFPWWDDSSRSARSSSSRGQGRDKRSLKPASAGETRLRSSVEMRRTSRRGSRGPEGEPTVFRLGRHRLSSRRGQPTSAVRMAPEAPHPDTHPTEGSEGVSKGPERFRIPRKLEREKGFEPSTSTLARWHSTTELLPQTCRTTCPEQLGTEPAARCSPGDPACQRDGSLAGAPATRPAEPSSACQALPLRGLPGSASRTGRRAPPPLRHP